MKTIFIITTRDYPINNSQFEDKVENYISPEEWSCNFHTYDCVPEQSWRPIYNENKPVPIKKGIISGMTFYVAPCMVKNNTVRNNYIQKLIQTIKGITAEIEYEIFLIVHDKDLGYDTVEAHSSSDSDADNYNEFSLDEKVCGFFTYQHNDKNNKNVLRSYNNENIQEKKEIDADIYGEFIKFLNIDNGINIERCEQLKYILGQLDLKIDICIDTAEVKQSDQDIVSKKNISTTNLSIQDKSFIEYDDYCEYDYTINRGVSWDEKLKNFNIFNKPYIIKLSAGLESLEKRYKNFLDSSIWFYTYSDPTELASIKIQIEENKHRYQLTVAREYREFYLRMMSNSNLGVDGGHKNFVSPFLFHSEQKLKTEIEEKKRESEKENKKNIVKTILSYKWRILLIDDHATRGLTIGEKEESDLTKLKIVQEELSDLFGKEAITTDCKNQNAKIYIDCASTIGEAQNKLKEKKYEIVLLDYLLGKKVIDGKTVTINNKEVREYGYELLKGIWYKENEKKFEKARKEELEKLYKEFVFDYKKGPDNRFYFMFISAFTTAVSERLLTEGWHRSEDYWYIGEGACPINTPYLFQYRLLHIMEKRMKDMGLSKMLYVNRNDFEKSYIKTNIIDVIYDDRTSIRQNANNRFNEVLSVLYNYKNLLVDTHNASNPFDSPESTLATDIVMKNAYIGGFLEHLTQLVYLTAFGTVRQWPEMWEEYQFLKSVVGRIEVIEKYIFKLKNNNVE